MGKYFYPLVRNPYRQKDISKAINVLKSFKLTSGKITRKFQNSFTKKIKTNFSLMVNSGSSANLLAFQCLINPYRKKRLKPGDEVLIPALCWSTSLWPIVQCGLKPKFVDIEKETLNFDLNDLEKKISNKTKAIMIVHVLGNSVDMDKLLQIKKKYNLVLVEDTCESLGTKYKKKFLGTFGEFSSFSFYSSHQISSGEGGMICCNNKNDYEIINSLKAHGWSRGLKNEKKIARENQHLDSRFIFYNSGFNLRSTDIAASIAHSQFQDLEKFIKIRSWNRDKIVNQLKNNKKINYKIKAIEANKNVRASWFGIPLILSKEINKKKFIDKLEKKGIETRPVISGNFLKQPSIKKYKLGKKEKMKNSEFVGKNGFFIGLPNQKISNKMLVRLISIIEKSF